MATIPDAVTQSIERFLGAVGQQRRIEAAYLYGSQAQGTATHWSDIDLAIVSPDFSTDLLQEQVALLCLAARIDNRLEPRPFRPVDFNVNDPLASEIQRTGVRVA